MTKHWNIKVELLDSRLGHGWSLQEALEYPRQDKYVNGKSCEDHNGKRYKTIREMCIAYGINYSVFRYRQKLGWDLEKILTTPVRKVCIIEEDNGNRYNSIAELYRKEKLEKIGRSRDTRLKAGRVDKVSVKGLREVLEKKEVRDHNGKLFESVVEMCIFWGLPVYVYLSRRKTGWTVENALTTPTGTSTKAKECKDHKGNEFASLSDMCKFWSVKADVFCARMKRGWTLEKALETPIQHRHRRKRCIDHTGAEFETIIDMCKHWGIDRRVFTSRIRSNWELEKALTVPVKHKK